jgi:hypothetical protein
LEILFKDIPLAQILADEVFHYEPSDEKEQACLPMKEGYKAQCP